MSNCLVTGGAGFIGSHLVDSLVESNHNVIVLDNLATGDFLNVNKRARFYFGDITNQRQLNLAFKDNNIDYVFHLAGNISLRDSFKFPVFDAEKNINGTINILQKCVENNVKKIIFSSTGGAIYDEDEPLPWSEEFNLNPKSPYGMSKLSCEKYIDLYYRLHGLKYNILRLANVYGPRQDPNGEAGVVSILMDRIKNNQSVYIFGNGKQSRDFVYVSDVIKAFNLIAFNSNLSNEVFNVSTGLATTVNNLLKTILEINDKKWENKYVMYKNSIPGEIFQSCLDYFRISELGWEPEISLKEGLTIMIDFLSNYVRTKYVK